MLCWICSVRFSSHWLAIMNEPTHVWREPKLFPHLVKRQAAKRPPSPQHTGLLVCPLQCIHTHESSGHQIPQLEVSSGLLSLSNLLKVTGSDADGASNSWKHPHTKSHYNSLDFFLHTTSWTKQTYFDLKKGDVEMAGSCWWCLIYRPNQVVTSLLLFFLFSSLPVQPRS